MPRPVEALPCGSASSSSTRSPTAARAVPRLMAVVVLPTPPFWLAMARMRQALAGTGEALQLEDAAARVAEAGRDVARETPSLARLGDLRLDPLALEEQANGALGEVGKRKAEQTAERGHGAGGDDVGLQR